MDWWLYMTKMPSFQSFVERDDICVRCMKVESMKHLPTDTREINGAALPNSFDSENNRWYLGQIEVEGNCEIVELYEIFNIFVQRE